MFSKTVTVGSTTGLHVRPAAVIAEAAGAYDEEILIALADAEDVADEGVDAASSLMIMTLGAEHGSQVVVASESEAAVAEIAGLIERNLDE